MNLIAADHTNYREAASDQLLDPHHINQQYTYLWTKLQNYYKVMSLAEGK